MKIIDENGRLWGKISVIDLLVIAVVLVMALALYVKNVRSGTPTTSTARTSWVLSLPSRWRTTQAPPSPV